MTGDTRLSTTAVRIDVCVCEIKLKEPFFVPSTKDQMTIDVIIFIGKDCQKPSKCTHIRPLILFPSLSFHPTDTVSVICRPINSLQGVLLELDSSVFERVKYLRPEELHKICQNVLKLEIGEMSVREGKWRPSQSLLERCLGCSFAAELKMSIVPVLFALELYGQYGCR